MPTKHLSFEELRLAALRIESAIPARLFLNRWEKSANGCWNWMGSLSGNGYGQVSFGPSGAARKFNAHRVVYVHFKGSIPAGMQLDHLCFNRKCVNPSHLEAVPAITNIRRQRNTKLTPETASAIKDLIPSYRGRFRELGRLFGVGKSIVSHIKNGRAWA